MTVRQDEVRLRDSVGFAVRVFVAVWVAWALLGVVGVLIVPSGAPVSVPGRTAEQLSAGWHNAFTVGDRGDALWYQRIADDGYRKDDGSAAFFPLYPAVVHVVSLLPGVGTLLAATAVAQGSFLGALVVFHGLTAREYGWRVAQRAVVLLAMFPTAFFFLAPYSEAPFLLLVLLTFWYARADRWVVALVPAALAGLARSVGIVLVAALAVEAFGQWRERDRRLLPRLVVALSPAAGTGVYFAYWALTGDPAAPLDAQEKWQRVMTSPLETVGRAVEFAVRYRSWWLIDLLVVAMVVAAVVAGWRMLSPSYLTYAWASLLLPLLMPFPSRPLLSMPRFVLVVFPAVWVVARSVERGRLPGTLVAGAFAGGYALLGVLFTNYQPIF